VVVVVISALAAAAVMGTLAWVLPNPSRMVATSLWTSALIAFAALLVMVRYDAGLARYDQPVARWSADHATNGSTRFVRYVTALGGTYVAIGIALTAGVVEYARTRVKAVFAFLAVVMLGQVLATNLVKGLVDRARPDVHRLAGVSGPSFPSGHSATAAATLAAVALLAARGRSRSTRSLLAAGAGGVAAAVAATRVLLGVHWVTDALAGLAMGWAWCAVGSIAAGDRLAPVEPATSGDA
jgi:undecaprenyl-diphosphatase